MSASSSACSSGHCVGQGVRARVGERDPDVLGLGAVDQVAEDPAAAALALAVAALAAEAAASAGADAGDQHPVTGRRSARRRRPRRPCRPPRGRGCGPGSTSGTSPLRMCRSVPQMVTASTRTIASSGSWMLRSRCVPPLHLAWGRRRRAPSSCWCPFGVGRMRGRHGDDGAVGVVEGVVADGAEQQPSQARLFLGSDHQQRR